MRRTIVTLDTKDGKYIPVFVVMEELYPDMQDYNDSSLQNPSWWFIGSEIAAENAAFMFSVTESCSLNGINPESYLEDVFRSILFGTDRDKRDFLPCYYQAHELPKMNALEVAIVLSTAA